MRALLPLSHICTTCNTCAVPRSSQITIIFVLETFSGRSFFDERICLIFYFVMRARALSVISTVSFYIYINTHLYRSPRHKRFCLHFVVYFVFSHSYLLDVQRKGFQFHRMWQKFIAMLWYVVPSQKLWFFVRAFHFG